MLDVHKKCKRKGASQVKSRKDNVILALNRFLLFEQRKIFSNFGDFTVLIGCIQEVIKNIASAIRHYGLFKGIQTGMRSVRSYNEKKLVDICELIFFTGLTTSASTCLLASSLCPDIIDVDNEGSGKYIVTFVSLDGHSPMDNSVMGSIFSVFRRSNKLQTMIKEDVMQFGTDMAAAGYAVYGTSTTIIFAPGPGMGIYEFILDPTCGLFILSGSRLQIPTSGEIYSLNEGKTRDMNQSIIEYISKKKEQVGQKQITSSFSGSLIADFHKIMKHGGILISPAYQGHPHGKLKLQFHCNPLAFILGEAGGLATNGKKNINEVSVLSVHQTTPLFCGSVQDVKEAMRFVNS